MNPNQTHRQLRSMSPYGNDHKRTSSVSRPVPYNNIPKSATNQQTSFCLMDISVTIRNLNGILMTSKKKKEKRPHDLNLGFSGSNDSENGGLPVTAVVSFSKNVTSSQTSIASHFPSSPIQESGQYSDSNKHRFIASWPNDYDEMGNKLCTFQFTRMMRQEYMADGYNPSSKSPICVPERVKLTIGLTRGSEMINIGTSTLILMGDESQNVQMNLPVSLEKADKNVDKAPGLSKTKSNSSFFSKGTKTYKPKSFSKDPHRKYSMDQNACLKVLVDVRPSESTNSFSHAREMYHGMNPMEYSVARSSRSLSRSAAESGSASESRSGSIGYSGSGSGCSSSSGRRGINQHYMSQPAHMHQVQPYNQEEHEWSSKKQYKDERSYSIAPYDEEVDDNKFISTPFFCGALMDLMSTKQFSNQQNPMKSFKRLQKQARLRTSTNLSVMPTYRQNDDNESQFIPPAKIYARSFSSDEDNDENELTGNGDDDSENGQSRHGYHSVATAKVNNKNALKAMEETRASYANRIGINPDTMI